MKDASRAGDGERWWQAGMPMLVLPVWVMVIAAFLYQLVRTIF